MQPFHKSDVSFGCIDVPGFKTAGVPCDIRNKADGRLDLALILSEDPCTAAGVFTLNKLAAAPVRLGREMLSKAGSFRAIVVNSGNANACTGAPGMAAAKEMRRIAAEQLDCAPEEVFVCSTGRIGQQLPLDRIEKGIQQAVRELGAEGEDGLRAADAILTSDTRRKVCTVQIKTTQGPVRLAGMAKGAGMIEPNMATMLAFLCTDADVSSGDLQSLLTECTGRTFNAITVDGDESTNDTVLLLANGRSGISLKKGTADWQAFKLALEAICMDLAAKIVGDGEKITKVVKISIKGAATDADAASAARALGNSLLVKSSWYGNDPNWGRLMDALGYSGAEVSEESVRVWYASESGLDPVPVFDRGIIFHENKDLWKARVGQPRFSILIDLGKGACESCLWATDLTEDYVNFNKSE